MATKKDDKKMIKVRQKGEWNVNSQLTILKPNAFWPKSNHMSIESNQIPIACGQIDS